MFGLLAYYETDPELLHNMSILAEDLETTTEVVEAYLGTNLGTKVYIGGGEITPEDCY